MPGIAWHPLALLGSTRRGQAEPGNYKELKTMKGLGKAEIRESLLKGTSLY